MKYLSAILLTPICFALYYVLSIIFFGFFFSFITWDWSIIAYNILPWITLQPNIGLRALSIIIAIISCFIFWGYVLNNR